MLGLIFLMPGIPLSKSTSKNHEKWESWIHVWHHPIFD